MNVLIIGGSSFLGPHLVDCLHSRRHHVTLFNRGRTPPPPSLLEGVEFLVGDRERDVSLIAGRWFDAVIDTCGFVPRLVRLSAAALAPKVAHYTFVSTLSVYADPLGGSRDEDAPIAAIGNPAEESVTPETYGPLKALCEDEVRREMNGRSLIVRPGLIVGPLDPTDRFTYWPHRFALGGDALVPGEPDHHTSFIDVRDLAAFVVESIDAGLTGTFNISGDPEVTTMGSIVDACVEAAGEDSARPVWVDESFLTDNGVSPWSDLPVWLPSGSDSLLWASSSKAVSSGLVYRPLTDTVRETLAWTRGKGLGRALKAGLSRDRESALLARYAKGKEKI